MTVMKACDGLDCPRVHRTMPVSVVARVRGKELILHACSGECMETLVDRVFPPPADEVARGLRDLPAPVTTASQGSSVHAGVRASDAGDVRPAVMRPIDCAHCAGSHPSIAEVEACGRRLQEQRREWLAEELAAMREAS